MSEPDLPSSAAKLQAAALRVLAGREHSTYELEQKLKRKFSDVAESEIEAVLAQLAHGGLQSDQRYADAVIRSRIAKGYGPYYIERELRAKGISSDLMEASQEWQSVDWMDRAQMLKNRRFPDLGENSRQEDPRRWQKAVRTFQQRGFSSSLIAKILAN